MTYGQLRILIAVAAVGLLATAARAQGVMDFTIDPDTGGVLCADNPDFLAGDNVFCKVSDNGAGGVRPVSAVIDPCSGTVYAGDARGQRGGLRVIPGWFEPGFDPAAAEVFIANPFDEPAGLNGVTALSRNLLLTGDRFSGRLYSVNLENGNWKFLYQTVGDPNLARFAACQVFGPGSESPCIGPGINNVEVDARGRIWFPVTTRRGPGGVALSEKVPDGFIVMIDAHGAVEFFGGPGEGFTLANGLRVEPAGEYVHMAVTLADPPQMVRMKIIEENGRTRLGPPETYATFPPEIWGNRFGPVNPGPDDIAFDADGNLYVVLVFTSALVVIPPVAADPELPSLRPVHVIFDATTDPPEAHQQALAAFTEKLDLTPDEREAKFGSRNITGADFQPLTAGTVFTNNPTGIAFGGPDLRRIFITSRGADIHSFEGPVQGMNPLVHGRGATTGVRTGITARACPAP